MEEESFPRGGVQKRKKLQSKQHNATCTEESLFQGSTDKNVKKGDKDSKKKKKKIKKQKSKCDADEDEDNDVKTKKKGDKKNEDIAEKLASLVPQILTKELLYPGMLVLGYVKSIQDYVVTLSLPNGMTGLVPITSISQAYTDSLQRVAEADEPLTDSVSTLREIFRVGLLLPCKLPESNKAVEGKRNIKLPASINPRDINEDLPAASLRNKMCIFGNISSIEDHGYIVDIGVKGVQAFLKKKEAETFIQRHNGEGLKVGQSIMCQVQMSSEKYASMLSSNSTNKVINVTIDPDKLHQTTDDSDIAFSSIVPGMKVKAKIEKVLKDKGLVLSFNSLQGVIHKSHLPSKPGTYKQGQQVKATVLFIHPFAKCISLTMLPNLVDYTGIAVNRFKAIGRNALFEDAKVTHVDDTSGVTLHCKDHKLFCEVYNLSDKKIGAPHKTFSIGSEHKCRVIGFYGIEGLMTVTLKRSIVEQKYTSVKDLHPGDIVECDVMAFENRGLNTMICKKLSGFISNIHLADVSLTNPQQKFKVGETLRCRVLAVKSSSVTLTNKKSLVTSKYPVISDIHQLQPDMLLEGFICNIRSIGCFVRFYNNVQGFVPKPLLSTLHIDFPEKVFFVGQVVRCKVVNVNLDDNKFTLTFVLDGHQKPFGSKVAKIPEDFKIGKCVECKVLKKGKTGLDVQLSGGVEGFLPKMHLSDSVDLCNVLWEKYKAGDQVEQAMYWNQSKTAILTCKQCLIKASLDGEMVTTFEELEAGMNIPGIVRNIMSYGVFVEFSNSLFGLVPNQYAADKRMPDLNLFYKMGQTVVAKVVEVNAEKNRFLASLRMKDCYHGDTEIGLKICWTYLDDRQKLIDIYRNYDSDTKETLPMLEMNKSTIAKMDIGSTHQATVTQTTEHGVLCELENGIKAVATKEHMEGLELDVGSTAPCVLMYQDFNKTCVEVVFTPDVVRCVTKNNKTKKAKKDKLTVGQKIKCNVLLIKDEFVVVCLRGDAMGQLAYLPSQRHWNDVLEKYQYEVGQENNIIIKKIKGDKILGSLKVHEDKVQEQENPTPQLPSHNFQYGDICTANITKIYPDQVYVKIGATRGRVHTTQMADTIENGNSPVLSLKIGAEIKVRVIGFLDGKSHKYLPISHPKLKNSMVDCSFKPSILKMKKLPEDYVSDHDKFEEGDKVVAFITGYSGNCFSVQLTVNVLGKVYKLNMSDDPKVNENPKRHFELGRGYNATVLSVGSNNVVELTFCDHVQEVTEGATVSCVVKAVKPLIGLQLQLPLGIRGTVDLTDISNNYKNQPLKKFKHGDVVSGHVNELSIMKRTAVVSLRDHSKAAKVKDRRIESEDDVQVGSIIRGFVTKISDTGLYVRIGHGLSGNVPPASIIAEHTEKWTKQMNAFHEAEVVTVQVKSFSTEDTNKTKFEFSMLESDTGVVNSAVQLEARKARKRAISESTLDSDSEAAVTFKKQRKERKGNKSTSISENDSELTRPNINQMSNTRRITETKISQAKINVENDDHAEINVTRRRHSESDDDADQTGNKRKEKRQKGPASKIIKTCEKDTLGVSEGFSWDADFKLPSLRDRGSSSEESEEDDTPQVKKSREHIRKDKIEEEKRLYKYEMECLEGERQPQTSDDFDRLVLQSPDSSLVWLRYMAFHLETSEIDKARAVAERALKTIAFREEQEKLNVWVAYLNLENMYGTPQSVTKVLERAVQHNDSIAVYLQMINIYVTAGQPEEGEQLFNSMVKKNSANKEVWIKYGEFYFQQNRLESARKLMQRSLKSLEMRHHIDVITKFAQMEFKHGEPERGKTMFENILSTYHKRTDLWSVYIDMITKLREHDTVRSLYNRVISQRMSAKKMKFFFKKYLQFEEKFGSESQVADVKRKALEYVEGQSAVGE